MIQKASLSLFMSPLFFSVSLNRNNRDSTLVVNVITRVFIFSHRIELFEDDDVKRKSNFMNTFTVVGPSVELETIDGQNKKCLDMIAIIG